jgi:hypothetical protein
MARFFFLALALSGCGCGEDEGECKNRNECDNHLACVSHECVACEDDSDCGVQGACELEPDGETLGCYDPVVVRGRVFDLATNDPVEGARVVGLDANASSITSVAISKADGSYDLLVPSTRDEEGAPVGQPITLRADAAGYETFPGGIRQAIAFDTATAEASTAAHDHAMVVTGPLTDIGLVATGRDGDGSIHGRVALATDAPFGVLVVAEMGGAGTSGIADREGDYAIFNLPAGSYTVNGYTLGASYEPGAAEIAGADVKVDLALSEAETGEMTGSVDVVNPGAGSVTSVILVVASTFDETLGRGDSPPGFRDPPPPDPVDVTNEFSIAGVPAGNYVILAGFENDFLIRDPDTCIAGTETLEREVVAGETTAAGSFKMTGSLAVISPEQNEVVSATPTLEWEDDTSEDAYHILVFDSLGQIVWDTTTGPSVVTATYAGDALQSGFPYQFRATSVRSADSCPISQTEDLMGVFVVE